MGFGAEPQRGLGQSHSVVLGAEHQRGYGGGAASNILAPKLPRGLGRSPKWLNQANQFSLAARSQICLNPVWRVGCEGSRSEPERSEGERSEAEDRSPPSQTKFRQIWL